MSDTLLVCAKQRLASAINSDRGFSFLELVVVIFIIGTLLLVGLDRYSKLMIVVEQTSMEHDLGVMRSAIGMEVARRFLDGRLATLEELVASNPMDLLAEQPPNYLGLASQAAVADRSAGSWYFDAASGELVYLVQNRRFFETEATGKAQINFKILPVYSEKSQGESVKQYISGLTLKPLMAYRWQKPAI